ncbi:MAG: hypothetical protein FIB01_11260 [Gemmatimonadetes bacterium]|nr:hypothetical protein [Gemmatimonadota bacterium]
MATAGTAAAGVMGSLGYLTWWLELFSNFRPQYAAVLTACGCGLLLLRRPAAGVGALALAAVNALPLLHYYTAVDEPPAAGPAVSAVRGNVWFRNRRYEDVLRYVEARRPDIAVFLEVTPAWRDALRRLDGLLPYQAQAGGVFVASQRPLGNLRAAQLGAGGAEAVVFDYDAGGTPLTVIGAHTNWPLGPDISASRDRELGRLAEIARNLPRPLLVRADLNATAFSPVFDYVLSRAGLRDCAAGRGFSPTWPTQFLPLGMQIDHCLAGRGLAITRFATGPDVGSDHYPLEVGVRLGIGDGDDAAFSASLAPLTSRQ